MRSNPAERRIAETGRSLLAALWERKQPGQRIGRPQGEGSSGHGPDLPRQNSVGLQALLEEHDGWAEEEAIIIATMAVAIIAIALILAVL